MIKRLFVLLAAFSLFGCTQTAVTSSAALAQSDSMEKDASQPDAEKEILYITVGEHEFRAVLEENGIRNDSGQPGTYRFYVSDAAEKFTEFAGSILPYDVDATRQINIEEY